MIINFITKHQDTYYTKTKGSNFNTTIGSDPDKGKANITPMGSTTIGLKSTGSEKEQDTKATIGNGSIVIAGKEINKENNNLDLIRDLNRNKDKTQEITKDMITGALDGSMTIDNRLLLGFINQNVYERDENGEVKTDKDGNGIVMKDKNGNNITTNGYKSMGSDISNFGKNTAGALVGATGTIANTLKTTFDTIIDDKSSITNIANNWQTGQNSLTTAIMRGGDDKSKEIMEKINKGEATPEELQYLSSKVSKDGDGNLVFTSEGKSIIVSDANGTMGEQLGFNDKTTGQGYIDAGKTSTDNKTYMSVDAEERIHKTIDSESVAKNMANREVNYYNTMSFLTGGKGMATSNSSTGGMGSNNNMQSNWNDKFNTSTNQMLNQNTAIANSVNDKDKLYSTHFDKNGKAEFINDGNYNAYRKNEDGTLNYDNEISYKEGFGLNIEKRQEGDFEKQMKTDEVQLDLFKADLLYKKDNISVLDSINYLNELKEYGIYLKTNKGENLALNSGNSQMINNLQNLGSKDDNSYLYNYLPNFYNAITSNLPSNSKEANNGGSVNPAVTLENTFGFNLNRNIDRANTVPLSLPRTKESGTCNSEGRGEMGALREHGVHNGVDYVAPAGSDAFVPVSGIISNSPSSKKKLKALPGFIIQKEYERFDTNYYIEKTNRI